MLRRTLRLRAALPALFAALLLITAPLLHLLHLSSCSCTSGQRIHCATSKPLSRLCAQLKLNKPQPKPTRPQPPHRHDNERCPLCQMYTAIYTGFTQPQNASITYTIMRYTKSVNTYWHPYILLTDAATFPRAPPVGSTA